MVTALDAPPRYLEVPTSAPTDSDRMLVQVLAAGLHPRVRSQTDGSHYTSTEKLPLIPGIDGVGQGATAAIASAALRAARLQLVGSGQGSVSATRILAELPELARLISEGAFAIDARPVPLREVEAVWTAATGNQRIVLIPRSARVAGAVGKVTAESSAAGLRRALVRRETSSGRPAGSTVVDSKDTT